MRSSQWKGFVNRSVLTEVKGHVLLLMLSESTLSSHSTGSAVPARERVDLNTYSHLIARPFEPTHN